MKRPDPSAPAADQLRYARFELATAAAAVELAAQLAAMGEKPRITVDVAHNAVDRANEALAYAAGQVGA